MKIFSAAASTHHLIMVSMLSNCNTSIMATQTKAEMCPSINMILNHSQHRDNFLRNPCFDKLQRIYFHNYFKHLSDFFLSIAVAFFMDLLDPINASALLIHL